MLYPATARLGAHSIPESRRPPWSDDRHQEFQGFGGAARPPAARRRGHRTDTRGRETAKTGEHWREAKPQVKRHSGAFSQVGAGCPTLSGVQADSPPPTFDLRKTGLTCANGEAWPLAPLGIVSFSRLPRPVCGLEASSARIPAGQPGWRHCLPASVL